MHLRHFLVICSTAPLLTFLCGLANAQDAAKPLYSLKEDQPRLGSNIKRDQLSGSRIAVNLPYAQLPPEDKQKLHSWWESIPAGDEPPFPVRGLQALYDPLRKAIAAIPDSGDLFAVATVGADGKVIQVKIYETPSDQMARFAGQLLFLTAFKPAVCSGQPCRMDFPLQMKFAIEVR